ncbi:carbohydrate kinase family protein [Nocardioides insulae]|uniref:carbohydrate kinase family protein n=1 Tax=Nocardioides insulae TaxID=394734 RepID=UPI000414FC10|nr:carbohydrate kinase family protein [Nocardioides insulae]
MQEGAGVVVIGATNMDLKAISRDPVVFGTSNPATTQLSPGGVGRNIADNLARLGTRVHLVSVVGDDPLGAELIESTSEVGVDVSHVRRRELRTGTYAAVLTPEGDLVVGIADTDAAEQISPLAVRAARDLIERSGAVCLDGTVPAETVHQALTEASRVGVSVVLDPVSVPSARRIAELLGPDVPLDLITPTRAELAVLAGGLPVETEADLEKAVQVLHGRSVRKVWVRLGRDGSLFSDEEGMTRSPAVDVEFLARLGAPVDVTGAEEAGLAAYIHARMDGLMARESVRYGLAASALTVTSPHTVRTDLSDEIIRALL